MSLLATPQGFDITVKDGGITFSDTRYYAPLNIDELRSVEFTNLYIVCIMSDDNGYNGYNEVMVTKELCQEYWAKQVEESINSALSGVYPLRPSASQCASHIATAYRKRFPWLADLYLHMLGADKKLREVAWDLAMEHGIPGREEWNEWK